MRYSKNWSDFAKCAILLAPKIVGSYENCRLLLLGPDLHVGESVVQDARHEV